MKVIFLDFDGVLNSLAYREKAEDYYNDFIDETRMPLLKELVDKTGALIVLTTTWRIYWNKEVSTLDCKAAKINNIFSKYGLQIYNKTANLNENRNFEILMFLSCNEVENYVILDDIDFGWSDENRRRFVQTDDRDMGLDEKTVQKAIEILGITDEK